MKKSQLLLIVSFLIFTASCSVKEQKLQVGVGQRLTIKSDFFSHTEDGIWKMSIEEHGKAGGAKFTYSESSLVPRKISVVTHLGVTEPRVRVVKTSLSKGQVESIEKMVREKRFFSTPKRLMYPVQDLHTPRYNLKVCLEKNCHSVYSDLSSRIPKNLLNDFDSFTGVWNLLWSFAKGPGFDNRQN